MTDRIEQLREMQEIALDHAVEEMQAAHKLNLETKTSRGDRGWLTGMATKSVGVAVKIEQYLQMREARKALIDPDEEDRHEAAMVRKASAEVSKLLETIAAGPQERKRGKRATA